MNSDDYLKESAVTCLNGIQMKELTEDMSTLKGNLMHAALGIAGESGEIVDLIKKKVIYSAPIDPNDLEEEIGDLFWYIAIVCRETGTNFESIMDVNIEKLRKRYPDGKWTAKHAIERKDKQ